MDEKKGNSLPPVSAGEFHICEELAADCGGLNYRAVELRNGKTPSHKILTRPHPQLLKNHEDWEHAVQLFDRIRELGVPFLESPERLIALSGEAMLVYPFINGKTLSQIAADAAEKEKPIPFELAFFIAIAVTGLLDLGSSIIVKERNAIHGFLTPDNIIIDYEGGIYLKYFGMWPIFEENETLASQMIAKYGAWLPPEFIRKERLVKQSDFYHLGYAVYRMLTGHYFSYLPGEDFETTFTSISFSSELPSTDISFLTTLIHFFKKTLNPVISKRFENAKEFKTYILTRFHPHLPDYGEFRQRLTAFLKELYGSSQAAETERLTRELTTPPPPRRAPSTSEMTATTEPEEIRFYREKKSRKPLFVGAAIVAAGVAVGGYFFMQQLDQTRQEKEIAAKMLEKQEQERRDFEKKFTTMQQRINELESQKTSTAEAEQARTDEIARLKEEQNELKRNRRPDNASTSQTAAPAKPSQSPTSSLSREAEKPDRKMAAGPDAAAKPPVAKEPPAKTAASTKPLTENSATPAVESPDKDKKVKPAPPEEKDAKESRESHPPTPAEPEKTSLITALNELTVKPTQTAGSDPVFPETIKKTYLGRRATVNAELLLDENGQVTDVRIYNSDTPADVNRYVVENFKTWKFSPAQKNGVKVRCWWPVKLKIHFRYTE